ncbi:hypothetical protein LO763_19955 [Glycomyces sp. A-F 0318]|uniref:hypothetical protein n=1 Tax=Glycomyces amatae TaxID=2881355 RepID=UPI001E613B92|nr:hypothetical protein [Glycomyces amatae]MCD0445888.1 hypothetical protein [Glycomyces amatae]
MKRKHPWMRVSDRWIEFALVPLALATVLGVLWSSASSGGREDEYGIAAIGFGIVWGVVLIVVDLVRYRHKAAWLLVWPLVGAVWAAWFGVYDYAMDERGLIEACPVATTSDEEVETRGGGTYWERTYTLACELVTVMVTDRIDSQSVDYDTGPVDPGSFGPDSFVTGGPLKPETIEVEYDPYGLLAARATDETGPSSASMLWLAGGFLAAGVGIRLSVAVARAYPLHRRAPA